MTPKDPKNSKKPLPKLPKNTEIKIIEITPRKLLIGLLILILIGSLVMSLQNFLGENTKINNKI